MQWRLCATRGLTGPSPSLTPIRAGLYPEGLAVPQTRRIETSLAAWSLLAGLVANFTGFMLIGRVAWPLCLALIAIGTGGLIGAMLLVAAADRNHRTAAPPPAAHRPKLTRNLPPNGALRASLPTQSP
jgi:hypothetical protein